MKYYTGIGSRATPNDVLLAIEQIARNLMRRGFILRSGAAEGADAAFERGAGRMTEIWLPWPRYKNHPSRLFPIPEAFELAAAVHPAWHSCNEAARKLHARNVHQVLGKNLKSPSSELICWTPRGEIVGGTATALRIAMAWRIPIRNLALEKVL